MINILKRLGSRFLSCRSGNFAVIAAVSLVPVIGLAGAAMDYSRASDFRTRVQQAADAAVLAAAQTQGTFEQKKTVGVKVFQANTADLGNVTLTPIFGEITNGVHVDISASIGNTFMKTMGKATSGFDVKAEAVMSVAGANGNSGPAVEIALVLDTTGSMKNDIGALRTSAASLVGTVMKNSNVYVSVVPFVAAVNVGATNIPMSAMDTGANSKWHASFYINAPATRLEDGKCRDYGPPSSGGGGGGGGGGGPGGGKVEGSLQMFQRRFASIATELFGIKSAQADVTANTIPPYVYSGTYTSSLGYKASIPTGFVAPDDWECTLRNPAKISHFDLFNRTKGATWKGCVEARPEPYDVTDDAPNSGNANTLFVPYFWPDERDVGNMPISGGNGIAPSNNYIPDEDMATWPAGWKKGIDGYYGDGESLTKNILKYNRIYQANIKETAPDTLGPNKSCPDELQRLSNNKTSVLNKVNSLNYWSHGGTIASEGLAWGWRTLSPNAPFADAKPYATDNHKIIVLMSDGVNEFSANDWWPASGYDPQQLHVADYTAYGLMYDEVYSVSGPMLPARFEKGKATFADTSKYFDGRLAAACTNAKAKGIQIYTVIFRETDTNAVNNMKNCASKPEMAYKASDQTALKNTFDSIASDINANNGGTQQIMPRLVK